MSGWQWLAGGTALGMSALALLGLSRAPRGWLHDGERAEHRAASALLQLSAQWLLLQVAPADVVAATAGAALVLSVTVDALDRRRLPAVSRHPGHRATGPAATIAPARSRNPLAVFGPGTHGSRQKVGARR